MDDTNQDLLSQVQLRACELLSASPYFTPVEAGVKAIPVISEVRESIAAAIKARCPAGMALIVALEDMPCQDGGGGCLRLDQGRLLIRVRENIPLNRSSGGTGENALRVAQAVVPVLHCQRAAKLNGQLTGQFTFLNIEPALADAIQGETANILAYHVRFRFNGTIVPFTRASRPASQEAP